MNAIQYGYTFSSWMRWWSPFRWQSTIGAHNTSSGIKDYWWVVTRCTHKNIIVLLLSLM